MDGLVRVRVRDGVGTLTMAAGPVNALSAGLRAALAGGLDALARDEAVRAVVLTGAGATFSAGADLREADADPAAPSVGDLCHAIEALAVPVIAALPGLALGGGAALALAAHWRIGAARARLGLPEATLGLVAAAGATQRLPRLVGAPVALAMMLGGGAVGAEAARRLRLLDGVATGDLASGADAFARALLDRGAGPRPTHARRDGLRDGRAFLAAVAAARNDAEPGACSAVVDCVEAALLLPFGAGCLFEEARAEECAARPEARALRHLFLAERQASRALIARAPDGSRELTDRGEALVERLARAMGQAAGAIARGGTPPARIDAALIGWGMTAGPFGHQAGDAAPDGPTIVRRVMAAVAAEGARLVAEGLVEGMGVVDAIAVAGLGLPRACGGPMRMAEADGLMRLCDDMARWAADDEVWAVPPLLHAAARAGGFATGSRAA